MRHFSSRSPIWEWLYLKNLEAVRRSRGTIKPFMGCIVIICKTGLVDQVLHLYMEAFAPDPYPITQRMFNSVESTGNSRPDSHEIRLAVGYRS